MTLTMNEAIQLILDFYYISQRYWREFPIEDPLVCHFIKEGYAALGEERPQKYVLSKKGGDLLHTYIQKISTDFIEFIKKNQLSCSDTNATLWFSNSYSLDTETAENLYDYIAKNLKAYGYEGEKIHQLENGCGYQFKKVDA